MNLTALLPSLIDAIVGALKRRKKVRELVLPLIEQAAALAEAGTANTNESRREFVVAALMKQGLSESDARLLTEAGVKLWKKIQAKLAKKAGKAAASHA